MFVAASLLSWVASLLLATLVQADCECGYVVNSTLYTDLLETDFLHLNNITNNTDWQAQKYQITPALARGPYGKDASPNNVVPNPLANHDDWAGNGINGGDAGLQMVVKGGVLPKGGMIPMAEIVSNRTDLLYGSFRVGMRLTATNGTCGAFFWVYHDLHARAVSIETDRPSTLMIPKKSIWNFSRRNTTPLLIQSTSSFNPLIRHATDSMQPTPVPLILLNYPSTPRTVSMNIVSIGLQMP